MVSLTIEGGVETSGLEIYMKVSKEIRLTNCVSSMIGRHGLTLSKHSKH